MVGLPGQSPDDARRTMETVARLGAVVRPTFYSYQGEADSLFEQTVEDGSEDVGRLDRKSFASHREEYGAMLRLAFDAIREETCRST